MNSFLLTLFQNLFSAEQELIAWEKSQADPREANGDTSSIESLLQQEGIDPKISMAVIDEYNNTLRNADRHESNRRFDQEVRAKQKVFERKVLIETYMDYHYKVKQL